MKRYLVIAIFLLGLFALNAFRVAAQNTPMTPNEDLVMKWIDASVKPDVVQTAVKDMLASDFVFYGDRDNLKLDVKDFIRMTGSQGFLPAALNCVVKSGDDLVQATYLLVTAGSREESRTILFRIENGHIAEAWLDHTL